MFFHLFWDIFSIVFDPIFIFVAIQFWAKTSGFQNDFTIQFIFHYECWFFVWKIEQFVILRIIRQIEKWLERLLIREEIIDFSSIQQRIGVFVHDFESASKLGFHFIFFEKLWRTTFEKSSIAAPTGLGSFQTIEKCMNFDARLFWISWKFKNWVLVSKFMLQVQWTKNLSVYNFAIFSLSHRSRPLEIPWKNCFGLFPQSSVFWDLLSQPTTLIKLKHTEKALYR